MFGIGLFSVLNGQLAIFTLLDSANLLSIKMIGKACQMCFLTTLNSVSKLC